MLFHELRPVQTVVLDRVTLYAETTIDAAMLHEVKADERMRRLEYEDAYARRSILRMFGKTARIEMSCPSSWWEHLKQTLKVRWPKWFGALRVKLRIESAETGAVMTGLPPSSATRMVIPFVVEPRAEHEHPFRKPEPRWEPTRESLRQFVISIARDRHTKGRKVTSIVVHPADFYDFTRSEERRDFYTTGDRQELVTPVGLVRIDIDASQTRGVVGIP